MLAAVYTRVSSEEQVKGYSLAEQERACREKARELGAQGVTVFSDEGISGSLLERPGLTRLREVLYRREILFLICRDPDRLARNLAHQLIIADECEKYGAELVFTGWDWQKTPEGQLFFAIRGAVSQYEREKIRERMKRGKMQKARSGIEPNRIPIFGYRYHRNGQAFIENREAGVVRDIFRWFVSEDTGLTAIAHRLEERGIPAPGGQKKWHKQTVKYILSNATYSGKHYFNRRNDTGVKNNKYTKSKARRVQRPETEWIEIPYPKVIEAGIFNRAREKLARSRRLWSGGPKHSYLLSGLLRCGKCGNTMTGMRTNYRRPHRPDSVVYSCKREKGCICCRPNRYVKGAPLENAVWECVLSWLERPEEVIRQIKKAQDDRAGVKERIMQLTDQLKAIKKGKKNVLGILAAGTTEPDDTTNKILGELNDRETAVKKQLETLKNEFERELSGGEIMDITSGTGFIHRQLHSLDIEGKRTVIRAFLDEITVYGHHRDVTIEILAAVPSPQKCKPV